MIDNNVKTFYNKEKNGGIQDESFFIKTGARGSKSY